MRLRFEIGLDDIGIGLDMMSNSGEEREEVLDFITHLDESMADADFTQNLIYRLSVSLAEESEVRGWEKVKVGERTWSTFSQLYEALSHMSEDKLIALMANAMLVRRQRDKEAAAKDKPLPLATVCVCGHNLNWHEESHGPDKGCMADPTSGVSCECAAFRFEPKPGVIEPCDRCGCARTWHRVKVGEDRTGCYDHMTCDEWIPKEEQ